MIHMDKGHVRFDPYSSLGLQAFFSHSICGIKTFEWLLCNLVFVSILYKNLCVAFGTWKRVQHLYMRRLQQCRVEWGKSTIRESSRIVKSSAECAGTGTSKTHAEAKSGSAAANNDPSHWISTIHPAFLYLKGIFSSDYGQRNIYVYMVMQLAKWKLEFESEG